VHWLVCEDDTCAPPPKLPELAIRPLPLSSIDSKSNYQNCFDDADGLAEQLAGWLRVLRYLLLKIRKKNQSEIA
jgi:hypothetical protein